jgi:hypothetical protein
MLTRDETSAMPDAYMEAAFDSPGHDSARRIPNSGCPTEARLLRCLKGKVRERPKLTYDGAQCHDAVVKTF